MEIMPKMLSLSDASNEFAKYFIDSPNAELNIEQVGSRLTVIMNDIDLPAYGNTNIAITEFEDHGSSETQTDVQRWMSQTIKNSKGDVMA